jgi:MoxR-like ATPase
VSIRQYIVTLVRQSRAHPALLLGASPRAASALMRAAQAKAMIADRTFVVPDDVKAMAPHVLAHRLILKPEARAAGHDSVRIVDELLRRVAVPNFRHAAGEDT